MQMRGSHCQLDQLVQPAERVTTGGIVAEHMLIQMMVTSLVLFRVDVELFLFNIPLFIGVPGVDISVKVLPTLM
jgi:uncharacterized membrane-anchored protein YitT (DUF2179 family)